MLFLFFLPAFAQTLVEVTTAAAISSSLDASVRLPTGSYRAGKGSELILARMPDAAKFNLEVFAAKGVAARLQPAFIGKRGCGGAIKPIPFRGGIHGLPHVRPWRT